MPDVVMPRLSDSMEEGTIVKWLRAAGDDIAAGDELVEIETDKATMTYAAAAAGELAIVAQEGETHPIGALIARIAGPGAGEGGTAALANGGPDLSPQASPASVSSPAPRAPASRGTGRGEVTTDELTRTQQLIARRMAEAKATVPEFTISTDVDMGACVELRAELATLAGPRGDAVPTYNDIVVKASALALREHPRVNGAYRDGRFERYSRVNVGVPVATEDSLVVPTVFDADRKPLAEIARDMRALAGRVRAGAVTPPELSGGTFTVSNLGMFGVTRFAPVINAPQAAILAVGELAQRVVVRDGEPAARPALTLTLVCDHRILYGADAARFLARVRALLQAPLALALPAPDPS